MSCPNRTNITSLFLFNVVTNLPKCKFSCIITIIFSLIANIMSMNFCDKIAMSRQLLLDSYFQSKSSYDTFNIPNSLINSCNNKSPKKRNLSLRKPVTPTKICKVASGDNSSIISLSSDDEDDYKNPIPCESGNSTNSLNSSQDTVIYSLTPNKSPCSNYNIPQSPVKLEQTPKKQSQTPTSSTLNIRSPRSINKYFSPNKKRLISKKSPVKRNLVQQLNERFQSHTVYADDTLKENHQEQDDKTVFLLKIIDKYLHDESLQYLLSEDYQRLIENCMHIEKPSIRLVCRLYWRKDCWYRKDKLKSIIQKNDEVTEVTFNEAIESLTRNGLITTSTYGCKAMTFDDYCEILNLIELKHICKEFKLINIKSKQAAVMALRKYSNLKPISNMCTGSVGNNSGRVLYRLSVTAGKCYKLPKLARDAIYRLYVLMYLGIDYNIIREKNLELMLINDKINRETYPIDNEDVLDSASIVFKSSRDFERYIQIHIAYEKFIQETNASTKCEIIHQMLEEYKNYRDNNNLWFKSLPVWLRRFTPMNLIVKILEAGIQDLKKRQDYDRALDILSKLLSQGLYRQHKRAEWFSEKALVLQKLKQNDEAARVLLEGFHTISSEEEKDIMRPRAKRLARVVGVEELETALLKFAEKETILEKNLRGVSIYKQPMENTGSKGKLKFHTRTEDGLDVESVEEFGLTQYLRSGVFNRGKHCEGRMVVTIFFILFWDIIYTKPPDCSGLFLSRFQKYPLDMFSQSFYTNRREDIDMRIEKLKTMSMHSILDMVFDVWKSRPKHELSGINREAGSLEDLRDVCSCLGGAGLAVICGRLAKNFWYTNSGFPDLTMWNTETKKIRFVEVKSDADKPSMKQIQWMHYLQQHGIDTEFCYIGVNTTKNKARASSN